MLQEQLSLPAVVASPLATAACKPELYIKLLLNDVSMVYWPSPLANSIWLSSSVNYRHLLLPVICLFLPQKVITDKSEALGEATGDQTTSTTGVPSAVSVCQHLKPNLGLASSRWHSLI